MRALIICDNYGRFSPALLARRPLCLMPLGAKPILQHMLENLARMRFKRIMLAVGEHADYVQGVFGTGLRWGIEIEYILTRGFEGVAETVKLAGHPPHEPLFVVPALAVADYAPVAFPEPRDLEKAPQVMVWGEEGDAHCPECLFLLGNDAFRLASSAGSAREAIRPMGGQVSRIEGAAALVRDLPSYWEANRKLLTGESPFGPPNARPRPRTRIHPSAEVRESALLGEAVEIGAACRVGPLAVVCDHCILDDGVEARECVILPGTLVGRNTSVVRAIADQGLLVDIDDGSELHVPDPFILGPASAVSFSGLAWDAGQRILALAALIALSPVLAVLALRGLVSRDFWRRNVVVVSREIASLSGRKTFVEAVMTTARTKSLALSRLPALWRVFRGDLALAGVEPISLEQAEELAGTWAEPRFSCRAGLVNPWHGEGESDPEDIERRVMEVYYAQTRSARGDMALLWKAARRFFSLKKSFPDR